MRVKINYLSEILLILALVMTLCSCQRKDLYYHEEATNRVRMNLTWTGVGTEVPRYNKVIFYPKGYIKGGDLLLQEFYMSSSSEILMVRPGEYDVTVYNYRTNEESQTVRFYYNESFIENKAYTGMLVNRSGVFDEYVIRYSPDELYCWSLESVIIEEGDKSDAYIQDISSELTSTVVMYDFHVDVVGLEHVRAVSAINSGFSIYNTLAHKRSSEEPISHKLDIEITERGFRCRFSAFHHSKLLDQELYFVVKLPDNTLLKIFRDVNNELDENGTIEYVEPIVIKYDGVTEPPGEDGGGFYPPEIGGWEGVHEEIII